jgi:hypothetical protein
VRPCSGHIKPKKTLDLKSETLISYRNGFFAIFVIFTMGTNMGAGSPQGQSSSPRLLTTNLSIINMLITSEENEVPKAPCAHTHTHTHILYTQSWKSVQCISSCKMFGNDGSVKNEALWGWEARLGTGKRGVLGGNENGGRK